MNLLRNHPQQRPLATPRWLALGGALAWGALELIALWRSRWTQQRSP
jgi:hypothetical protein